VTRAWTLATWSSHLAPLAELPNGFKSPAACHAHRQQRASPPTTPSGHASVPVQPLEWECAFALPAEEAMELDRGIAKRLQAGEEPSPEELDRLRAVREYAEDLEDQVASSAWSAARDTRSRAVGGGVAIVAGHTKLSPGASGVAPISQSEYFWNDDLAKLIKSECELNVQAKIFFRDGIGISGAYNKVQQWGASSVVELHFNSFNSNAFGTETLYAMIPIPGRKRGRKASKTPWSTFSAEQGRATVGLKKLTPEVEDTKAFQHWTSPQRW